MNRRSLAALLPLAALAACTPGQAPDLQKLETELASIITKVQAGVKAACAAVPTAETVVTVLLTFVSGQNPTLDLVLPFVQQAIALIATQCPGQPPAPAATVNGKEIPIVWY
jgi:hypothetical protein